MKLKTYTFDAPAHWASALINGDTNGLSDEDEAEFNAWCEANPAKVSEVVSCEDDSWIGRFNGLQTEMLTYQALEHPPPMVYLDPARITAKRLVEPPHNRSRTGYGSKIPTCYMLQLDGKRWHRVYCICHSNAGTLYVRTKDGPRYIETGFDLEALPNQ